MPVERARKPLTPSQLVLSVVRSPQAVEAIYRDAEGLYPGEKDWRAVANTYVLFRFLSNGYRIGYSPNPAQFAGLLAAYGGLFLPREVPPRPGFIYVAVNQRWIPQHIGLVTKTAVLTNEPPKWFISADQFMEAPEYRPYRREIGETEHAYPVGYWLKMPG